FAQLRQNVAHRSAKIYQPDAFITLRKNKWHLDAEVAATVGNVGSRAVSDQAFTFDVNSGQPLSFFQWGGALQSDLSFLPGDALMLGLEGGFATGDQGVYGFGARPWRSGSGGSMGPVAGGNPFNGTAAGDIDGPHFDYSNPGFSHGHINNFK